MIVSVRCDACSREWKPTKEDPVYAVYATIPDAEVEGCDPTDRHVCKVCARELCEAAGQCVPGLNDDE